MPGLTIHIYVTDMRPLEDVDELLSEGYMNVSALSIIFIAGQRLLFFFFIFTEEGFLLQSRFTNRHMGTMKKEKSFRIC